MVLSVVAHPSWLLAAVKPNSCRLLVVHPCWWLVAHGWLVAHRRGHHWLLVMAVVIIGS